VQSTRIAKLLVASLAGLVVAASTVGVAGAQGVNSGSSSVATVLTHGLGRLVLADEATAIARLLGISVDQLQHELVGHSLAEVAAGHGKSSDDVVAVVIDTANRHVDTAVTFGLMSSDNGAELKSEIATMAPDLVQSQMAGALALNEMNS
jgi:hypothetical protein